MAVDNFGLKKVTVLEGVALVVGNVIGISIFALPGPLANDAGPIVIVGILLAAIPLVFNIAVSYQLGSAIPTTGGNYFYASRIISPFAGFLLPWLILPGVWAGLLFISTGFAEYLGIFINVPDLALVYVLLIPFLVLNLIGIRLVAKTQLVLLAVLLTSMVLFIVPGAFVIEPSNYTPLVPAGIGPFALAIVSLYFPLRGFSMITNIGGELENPSEAIPKVLLYSAIISLALFVGLVTVLVGVVNWKNLGGDGAVVYAARTFLPEPLVIFILFGAIAGGLTSLSTTYTGFSRALMRAGNDKIFPAVFSRIHIRFRTPYIALLALGIPPLLIAPLQPSQVILSVYLATSVLTAAVLNAIALWRLPKKFPEQYENAEITLSSSVLRFVAVSAAVTSGILVLIVGLRLPWMLGIIAVYIGLGYIAYRVRVRQLKKANEDPHNLFKSLEQSSD